jgi:hypothetical protein
MMSNTCRNHLSWIRSSFRLVFDVIAWGEVGSLVLKLARKYQIRCESERIQEGENAETKIGVTEKTYKINRTRTRLVERVFFV